MVKGSIFLTFFLLSAGLFLHKPVTEALTCADTTPVVMQCATFATGLVSQPSGVCCYELNRLNGMTTATADRRKACNCLKQLAPLYPGVKDSNLAALPRKCRASLPFIVTRNTDCSKIN